jgi:hypothetical protein
MMEPKIIEKLSAEWLPDLDGWWWGLCLSVIHQAVPAVAKLLVGPPVPGRLAVRNQMKKQTIASQDCWGLGRGLTTLPCTT